MPIGFEQQPNKGAAGSLRSRTLVRMDEYEAMQPQIRARAFAVSGIEDMKALARIRDAVAKVAEGKDWTEARKEIAAELGGSERRAETVLRTNCFEAYAAARWREQQIDKDVMPYLVYHCVGDDRVRPEHRELDGLVLPADHPFWHTHYPPWDWGCRCTVSGMTQQEYDEEKASADTAFKFPTDEDLKRLPGPAKSGFSFDPENFVPDIREVAKRDYVDPGILHDFCEKMRNTPIELADGTQTNVHELMIRPAQREAADAVLAAGRKDGLEHALLLDADSGQRVGEMQTGSRREIRVDLTRAKREGRTVDVAHNHPSGNQTLSPADALFGTDESVHDVLAIGDDGYMHVRLLDKGAEMKRDIKAWKARIAKAKTLAEIEKARIDWIAWLTTMQVEGKLLIREVWK